MLYEEAADLGERSWYACVCMGGRMVCADADGKCVRDVFILIRGFCVVFHTFVFRTKGK